MIINGIDRVDSKILFKLSSGSATRGHKQKLIKNMLDLELSGQSLTRVINDWNSQLK